MADEQKDIITPMVSMAKMDLEELKVYTKKLSEYIRQPGIAAIRICECCIDISIK
jgi:hypothetical protein